VPDQSAAPVETSIVTGIAIYLGIVTILAGCLIFSLWSSRPADAVSVAPPQCDKVTGPTLLSVYPGLLSSGTLSKVLFVGCHFPLTTQVKVEGAHHSSTFDDDKHISVLLNASDVASVGPLTITLWDKDAEYATSVVNLAAPIFAWSFFGLCTWGISQEVQLLLLVLCVGSFGSSVYACKSLADFRGTGKLYQPWILFYLIQPLEGAGIAFLFYLLIRAGFLAGVGTDFKAVNQFGICAIAGLAGTFSDIAFMKLREVFLTLFKPQDDRGGKISPLKITTTALSLTSGTPYNKVLDASGGVPPLNWSVTPALPPSLSLNAATGEISGTPDAPAVSTPYRFTVTDSANPPASATVDITFVIQ
jgi:Putative Ig domain